MKNKALQRSIFGLSLSLISLTLFSFTSVHKPGPDTIVAPGFKLRTVVIDPGHGHRKDGSYSGASGSFSKESIVTLAVGLKLQAAIEKDLKDVKVVMTRTDEHEVTLQQRAIIANEKKGQLFISLHCNSLSDRIVRGARGKVTRVPDRSGKGVLLLVYIFRRGNEQEAAIRENEMEDAGGKENTELMPTDPASIMLLSAFKEKYRKQSLRFATLVNEEFIGQGRKSEGVREQSLHVLARAGMPSVLVEMGYINHPEEEEYMSSEEGQNEIVEAILEAIKTYKKEVEPSTSN
ncbi:N-acetylmuramoyl-L-alanine amidase family protein [Mucilaginibacter myungsuensis]|uniref:N-acetylmuramoyl-L-alanine amidase n=1 Tax=Mucilaginibacter myungsuensis TaxID=649104 RepID=A0A929KRT8_9SPHI|nr:N-acetylmuramoyl-L-alanine amidase [Mucilaginibacter myungsuensis]MBE9660339.1 N-acetylmuramoyl-L-alanine amidase [Mucilaginibacter myungsuensis]MDN3600381.1 N-acetylmuramoyl-L-alanine amidase [Mucilaginibacter myungsuensis]